MDHCQTKKIGNAQLHNYVWDKEDYNQWHTDNNKNDELQLRKHSSMGLIYDRNITYIYIHTHTPVVPEDIGVLKLSEPVVNMKESCYILYIIF